MRSDEGPREWAAGLGEFLAFELPKTAAQEPQPNDLGDEGLAGRAHELGLEPSDNALTARIARRLADPLPSLVDSDDSAEGAGDE